MRKWNANTKVLVKGGTGCLAHHTSINDITIIHTKRMQKHGLVFGVCRWSRKMGGTTNSDFKHFTGERQSGVQHGGITARRMIYGILMATLHIQIAL